MDLQQAKVQCKFSDICSRMKEMIPLVYPLKSYVTYMSHGLE